MNKEKRRAGRAIRKRRRKDMELLAAVSSIDYNALGEGLVQVMAQLGEHFTRAFSEARRSFEDFCLAYQESVEQERRMTHMSLTDGKEAE